MIADDPPQALRPVDLVERYKITNRLATEWLRRMLADDVITKCGRVFGGRWSAVDAWFMNGGQKRRGRGGAR